MEVVDQHPRWRDTGVEHRHTGQRDTAVEYRGLASSSSSSSKSSPNGFGMSNTRSGIILGQDSGSSKRAGKSQRVRT
jgi:hypothetical protein